MGLRFTLLLTARSALPYNITTGADDNGDLAVTDRPLNVSRNSARVSQRGSSIHGCRGSFGSGGNESSSWRMCSIRRISPTGPPSMA